MHSWSSSSSCILESSEGLGSRIDPGPPAVMTFRKKMGGYQALLNRRKFVGKKDFTQCCKLYVFTTSLGYGKEERWVEIADGVSTLPKSRTPMNRNNARRSTARYYLLKLPDEIDRLFGFLLTDYATISGSK